MKIVCLHQSETDALHQPTIVGSSADEHIVMIGSWRRQVTSYEVFKVDKSYYYVDDGTHSSRLVVCAQTEASIFFRQIVQTAKQFFEPVRQGWMSLTPASRRAYAVSWMSFFYIPLLLVVLGCFWIVNLDVGKVALAPTIENEDRRREFVYLALDEFVKTHPAPVFAIATPAAVQVKSPAVVKPKSCHVVVASKVTDSDVRKFLSPRFAKHAVDKRTRCQ